MRDLSSSRTRLAVLGFAAWTSDGATRQSTRIRSRHFAF